MGRDKKALVKQTAESAIVAAAVAVTVSFVQFIAGRGRKKNSPSDDTQSVFDAHDFSEKHGHVRWGRFFNRLLIYLLCCYLMAPSAASLLLRLCRTHMAGAALISIAGTSALQ